jgi:hypothetical protein
MKASIIMKISKKENVKMKIMSIMASENNGAGWRKKRNVVKISIMASAC